MKKEQLTLVGVGDVLIDREKTETMFQHVAEVLRSADIAYANCEQALSDKGQANPIQAAHSEPKTIAALLYAGIDIVSLANNHSLDWGREAFLDTMNRLKTANLPFVGAGANLAEAHQSIILERKNTKVGFLAYSSVHREEYSATADRSGVCPIRVWTLYEKVHYQPASLPRVVSLANRDDLEYMVQDIKKLKSQVDVVVLCMHWGIPLIPRTIPMYCSEIGHAAIDSGADLIIGTHSHIPQAIEVYKGKTIFYCTGNFAMELGPHMRDHEHVREMDDIYGRLDLEKRKYSMIVKAVIDDGKIKRVSFFPCIINSDSEPEVVRRSDPRYIDIAGYIKEISQRRTSATLFQDDGDEVMILGNKGG
jgi:poly-gamma-glutamate synthesis protein (capsule biosynthesis protein)